MNILTSTDADTGKEIDVNLLHEFGVGEVTPEKIRDLWLSFSKHDVLFSDETNGKFDNFFFTFVNPRSVWVEMQDPESLISIGVMSLSRVIPKFDAESHFTIWNGRARGKIPAVKESIIWAMDRYELRRISAEIPVYQSGVIRFVEKLGFQREGLKREAVVRKGIWVDTALYGLLRSEVEDGQSAAADS